ncbi:hypothetical protein [Photobacterium leiognathi]|uniref:hypothetical protein n=1 Tax=Photobacterium leiognathi TaxID=553611 RepID=UPI002982825D|nr:hypothetical protein [Photobacterium leiognathi]
MNYLKKGLMLIALLLSIAIFIIANLWTKVVRTLFWVMPRSLFAMAISYYDGRGNDQKTAVFFASLILFFIFFLFNFQLPISNYLSRYQDMSNDMYHVTKGGYDNRFSVATVTDKEYFAMDDKQTRIFRNYSNSSMGYARKLYPNPVSEPKYYNPLEPQKNENYFDGHAPYVQYYLDKTDNKFDRWIYLFNKGFEYRADRLDGYMNVHQGHFEKTRSASDLSSLYPIERPLRYSSGSYSLLPQFADFVLLFVLLWAISSAFIFDGCFNLIKNRYLHR